MNFVVIMPVYNSRDTVATAVRSALGEAAVSAVIVIDDGSTDDSASAVESIGDARIIVETQSNAGPSAARNRGIDLALDRPGVTHVLFLDADDEWLSDALERAAEIIRANPDMGVIVGARIELDRGNERQVDPPANWADTTLTRRGEIFLPQPFFGTSGMIVSRPVLAQGVRFDPRLRIGEDRDFAYRAAAIAPVYVSSALLLRVRLHRQGANLTGPAHLHRWLEDHLQLIEWHGNDEHAAAALHQQADWLLCHASRQLARRGTRIDADLWRAAMERYHAMHWPRPWRAIKWRYLLGPMLRPFT